MGPGENSISALDAKIAKLLSNDTGYSLEIAYNDGQIGHSGTAILGGVPGDNSVVVSRLVTINVNDTQSAFWRGRGFYPQLVEVRLVCWYL